MKTKTILSLLLCALSLPAAAFKVTVDTTSLNTQTGFIEIQFNPGSFPAIYETGTATITAFDLGPGSLGSISSGPDGGASGSLPGPLAIVNSDFYNGIVYNATFSTFASFLVEFTGNALSVSGQSVLSTLNVAFIGTTTLTATADLVGGGVIDTSFSSAEAGWSDVPEPSTFALMALGLVAAVGSRKLRSGR